MQRLGRTEYLVPNAYVNKAAPGKAVVNRQGRRGPAAKEKAAAGDFAASVKATSGNQSQSAENADGVLASIRPRTSPRTFREWIQQILDSLEKGPRGAASSKFDEAAAYAKIDLSFGVEELTYKNMWKVLKTVVKEIGVIKEASSGKFFLGVSQRLDKATTLMEFGSLAGFLKKKAAMSLEAILSDLTKGTTGQIVSDPASSLDGQGNIVPEAALRLLTQVG